MISPTSFIISPPTCLSVDIEIVNLFFLTIGFVYQYQRFTANFTRSKIQALPFICATFLNYLLSVLQESGAVARLTSLV